MQDYVRVAIKQAVKNNPVFLIGDVDPLVDDDNFTFVTPEGLGSGIGDFSDIYVHLNTTPPDYELFCYTRWFLLRNFMERNGFPVVLYTDSDVMFFENAEEEWSKFNNCSMTLTHRTSGHTSFITLNGIHHFCNMLTKIYSDKGGYHFNKIASHLKVRQEFGLPGGVCDMTLLEYFHYHAEFGGGPGRVGEMMSIINDSTYDHNINVSDSDYLMENGTKKVEIVNGEVCIYNKRLARNIKFNSLHFQGGAKNLMQVIYDRL